jgi:broad specificity phosphatase PhoE
MGYGRGVEMFLVRHGQPEWIRDGCCVVDPPLTDIGAHQAERLADVLQNERIDEFFVSPLLRAQQTAAPLAKRRDEQPETAGWLKECQEPPWHGEPATVATMAYEEELTFHPDRRWDGIDGGESLRDFTARIQAGLTDFLAARGITKTPGNLPVWDIDRDVVAADHRAVLVAHAGTNTVILSALLGLGPVPWEWDRFRLGHASITRLAVIPVGDHFTFSVRRLSDIEHLPVELRTS